MKQIVCLATSPWYPIPTRKQQVMMRMKDCEILYFDPSATHAAPLKDRSAWPLMTKYAKKPEKPQENITVYSLPPVLPLFYKSRAVNKLNQLRIASYIRKKMKLHGFEDPILWVYSPVTVDAVDHLPHRCLVYDCVDRHSAYGGMMDPALVDAMEEELAAKCDTVFATAKPLADRLKRCNEKTYFIPNGANYERFSEAGKPQPLPEDMADIPHPIFGFVGALQQCIEYGYLLSAAKEHPDWHFVLIGKEKPGVELSELRARKNVHFLGLKPNEQLPQYIAHFDACLNLFAESDLSRDVSPLKFYEYLATGKPIVSTPQPDQILEFEPLIQIARSEKEFSLKCAESLLDALPERNAARNIAGRQSSWDSRVSQMCKLLRENGIL